MAVRYIEFPADDMYPGSQLYPQGPRSEFASAEVREVIHIVAFSNDVPITLPVTESPSD